MSTRWYCVRGGSVLASVEADDVGEARYKLRDALARHGGSFVQSAISHACGYGRLRDGSVERKAGTDFRQRSGIPAKETNRERRAREDMAALLNHEGDA